ncbi:MAG: AAA family ATPase [Candidatus Lokiarchaeota archaeon]
MSYDYFEDLLRRQSLFKDESKLDINFVPDKLPFREKELSLLSQLFLSLLKNPNRTSRKVLIAGKTGIGKTVTIKLFSNLLKRAGAKRNLKIDQIHINCRKERTSYKVLVKLLHYFNHNIPVRGYSFQDLLGFLEEYLLKNNSHLIIILDELGYLMNSNEDILYAITRINDESYNDTRKLSLIGIIRDISYLSRLDVSTISTLQRNIIKFNPYSFKQIIEILNYRAKISIKENVISEEIIEMIAKIIWKNGDIRYGLDLIWKSVKIAESKNLSYISPECIRFANQGLVPFSLHEKLQYMSSSKLIFLLSIVKQLNNLSKNKITIACALNEYNIICENLEITPKSYSQIWNYLQEYEKENLITLSIISENIIGRKAFIEILDFSLIKLNTSINKILRSKGIFI